MDEFAELVLLSWKQALENGGDDEGAVSILASALSLATAEAGLEIDAVVSRVKDDHETACAARNSTAN